MVKDLDDLLTVHHFLDKALCLTDGLLLFDKVFGRTAADFLGNNHHGSHAHKEEQRHPDTVIQHDEKDADDNGNRAD